MTDQPQPDRLQSLSGTGRLALRAEDLTDREAALLAASEPSETEAGDGAGSRPYELSDIADIVGVENWWVERIEDGRMVPAEVTFGSPLGEFQDPPQAWFAHVPGSEEVLWPGRVRLVRRIHDPQLDDIKVTVTERGHLHVSGGGSPGMRIVADAGHLATAAGQRVAELVGDVLAAHARAARGEPLGGEPDPRFLASMAAVMSRRSHASSQADKDGGTEGTAKESG